MTLDRMQNFNDSTNSRDLHDLGRYYDSIPKLIAALAEFRHADPRVVYEDMIADQEQLAGDRISRPPGTGCIEF